MKKELRNRTEFIVAVVSEFGRYHHLDEMRAFRYMDDYGGIVFIDSFYDIAHTLSFNDVISGVTSFCATREVN